MVISTSNSGYLRAHERIWRPKAVQAVFTGGEFARACLVDLAVALGTTPIWKSRFFHHEMRLFQAGRGGFRAAFEANRI
jgi:hypothetical protein